MEKRKRPRFKRRVPLEFWNLESGGSRRRGFTLNISESGLFIATRSPFSVGNLIGIEVAHSERTDRLEGEVRSSIRIDPALRRLKQSGMGVRLLTTEEKMRAIINPGAERRTSSKEKASEERQEPREQDNGNSPLFPVYIDSPQQLSEVFDQHIRHGGVFVPTATVADVEGLVYLEFLFSWTPKTMFQTTGRVVKKFPDSAENGSAAEVSGLGVAFSDPQGTIDHFRQLLELPT